MRQGVKKFHCLGHGHLEYVGNIFSFVAYFEGITVVPLALAYITNNIHIGKELHLNLDKTFARTGFASAALHVKAEPAPFVSSHSRFRQLCEEFPDKGKDTCIRCGV